MGDGDATASGSTQARVPPSPGFWIDSQEPIQEVPLHEGVPSEHPAAEPSLHLSSRSPPLSPPAPASAARSVSSIQAARSSAHTAAPAARSPRRQRRRREPLMSQEAARRALVESSQLRAEAAVRSSHALENIQNTLQRIERYFKKNIVLIFCR